MFTGERAEFVRTVFASSKAGKTWFTLPFDDVVKATGGDRMRVVRMLDWLGENGYAAVTVKDVRHRFSVTKRPKDAVAVAALVDALHKQFADHEAREIDRIRDVLALVATDACLTNRLVAHFGEVRAAPCGHCVHCATNRAIALLPPRAPVDPAKVVDAALVRRMRSEHVDEVGHPRQLARFLCGLTSPRTSRARLPKHKMYGALFGKLEDERFHDVLAWCERLT